MTPNRPDPIAFLDRDGTIIEDPGYLSDPAQVRLLPGAAAAIRRLNDAGVAVVVVTNQSGIARGKLTEAQYVAVAARLDELLATAGARIDATAWCPHAPEISGPCDCRKPATGGHRRGAEAVGRSPTGGWCIGDRLSDLLPARELAGSGILVLSGEGALHAEAARAAGFAVRADLAAAVDLLLG